MKTQLGGKFSKLENGLFELKKKLESAGVIVEFPFNDGIIGQHNGIDVTFIPTEEKNFHSVEIDFFKAIKRNPIHVVHNKFVDQIGYIGVSASIEIAYAILHDKPILFLYKPMFSDSVNPYIKHLILRNVKAIRIKRIDDWRPEEVKNFIEDFTNTGVEYDINVEDEIQIMDLVNDLLESYK